MACNTDYDNSAGRDFLINMEDTEGSGTFTELFATTDATMTFGQEGIDVSNKSPGEDRYVISGNVKSVDLSGTGIVTANTDGFYKLEDVFNKTIGEQQRWTFEIVGLATGRTYTGCFMVSQLEVTGAHDGRQEFTFTLNSHGPLTITDPTP